ncbi:TRAP transporter small permease [Psychrobacillus sp. NEAU-3TGS]|uniref:TRAP transporter small permease n=1 Tax=Psychrobacillus sp. NEAU-3TGS TaxID=2995412 RepID=UPI002497EDE7|nr:TRAP transporter small permease [Psychrobacillus sp. NEAU-3TGS]MDI2589746.1 TRAP transporter small permease [Psychrobacillus sp. NEAU-3TGS]
MRILVKLEEWILIILMIIICLITFGNVLSRYLFHTSFSFTEEITTNLFAFIIFIGAALLARENGHLGFALITDFLPKKLQNVISFLMGCLTTVFFAILLWYGTEMVVAQFEYKQLTPALGLPEWVMGLAVPLGALLCLFRFWEGYIVNLKSSQEGGEAK